MNCPHADLPSSRAMEDLHPTLRAIAREGLRRYRADYNEPVQPFISQTYRNCEDQNRAVAAGTSDTPYGYSLHNALIQHPEGKVLLSPDATVRYRPEALAFDIAFAAPGQPADWAFFRFGRIAAIYKDLGLGWGGDWPGLVDGPHFQPPIERPQAIGPFSWWAMARQALAQLPQPWTAKAVVMVDGRVIHTERVRTVRTNHRPATDPLGERYWIDLITKEES